MSLERTPLGPRTRRTGTERVCPGGSAVDEHGHPVRGRVRRRVARLGARRATGGAPACLTRPHPHGAPAYRGGGLGSAARAPGPGWAPGPIPTSNVSFTCSRSRQSGWRFARGAPPPSAPHWPVGPTTPCSHSARGDAVVLTPCTSLAGATVAVLGTARPGPGRAAVVAAVDLEAALRRPTGAGLRADLVDRGVDPGRGGPDRAHAARHRPARADHRSRPGPPGHPAPCGRAARGSRRPARPLPDDPLPRRRRHRLDLRRAGRRPPPAPPVERSGSTPPERSVQVAVPHQLPACLGDRPGQ